jgi:hypothetical protein
MIRYADDYTYDTYFGEYKDGKREGYGTYQWANGDRYTGQFM